MKGCKNCPAFAKCTVTYRGSGCVALRSTYGVETDPEIITNADRIRGMDDNELAEFLMECNPANCQQCAFSSGWRCDPDREAIRTLKNALKDAKDGSSSQQRRSRHDL